MNIVQIERNLQSLIESFNMETFIFDLLLAYGTPKASISRLQNGNLNLSKVEGEIDWKKKLFFKTTFLESPQELFKAVIESPKVFKHEPRFVVITDYQTLIAKDTKTLDTIEISINELPKYFDFFLPWAGMEKTNHVNENPDDVKAADKMAKLFDEIRKDNPDPSPEFAHSLNVFLSRLLFCFFAEDTNIFAQGQFTNGIDSHTQSDGSDLHSYLDKLFEVLDTPEDKRIGLPVYLQAFPYVNGGLFRQHFDSPKFSRRSRLTLIQVGDLQWKEINPDIFGSMFQAVISVDQRGNLGQHYTSVPNIMKVIEPLFLTDLYETFEKAKGDKKKLKELLFRISKIKIFDPACGSGNFLIIAYKELRKLEMLILKELGEIAFSTITLNNFYGIEIDDFAHEIAQLSLWLAEHQMNVEFFNEFGRTNPTLPLREAGNIVQGNACRLNWEEVCPKNDKDEIYILGNPPYLGYSKQLLEQKKDSSLVLYNLTDYKKLDYIACWFYKGADYIQKENAKFAFVTTNSITQGEQVALLWPSIFQMDLEIFFAYQSFKWQNNAKSNAGVTVVIIGVSNIDSRKKLLFNNDKIQLVKEINPYLVAGERVFIHKRQNSISYLPTMIKGNAPGDGGHLLLSKQDVDSIINDYPESKDIIKEYIGADEFLYGTKRYCIWITHDKVDLAYSIEPIRSRIEKCKEFRLNSTKEATRSKAKIPHFFDEIKHIETSAIIVPETSSELRDYIPIGFSNSNPILSNRNRIIYDPEAYHFSILTSKIHNTWVLRIAGRLETRITYSNTLCYNTFPFPSINDNQKQELTQCAFRILEEREKHPEKTLAELYDPDKMPEGLREAHHLNDLAIERCYRSKPFESDEERLEHLFKLYEQMIAEEQNKGTLFSTENKTKTKSKKK